MMEVTTPGRIVEAQRWFRENGKGFSGQLSFDEPLSKYTYYRIGGPASILAIPKGREDLVWLANAIRETRVPFFILGAGSNLLVSDQGYAGLIIRCSRINLDIDRLDSDAGYDGIRTGGSVAISTLLRRAVQEGWGGLEFLTGIPGSIGGVVRMNGGTHLGEAQDRLRRLDVFHLSEETGAWGVESIDRAGFKFSYRRNHFLPRSSIVLAADWEIRPEPPAKVKAVIDETLSRRKSTQPVDYPSCGSVFKNPKESGMSAWQVVDKLGLRGHRIGDAQFAEKHSNFIINHGSARAADVLALIELAKKRARDELGVTLEEEVIHLG